MPSKCSRCRRGSTEFGYCQQVPNNTYHAANIRVVPRPRVRADGRAATAGYVGTQGMPQLHYMQRTGAEAEDSVSRRCKRTGSRRRAEGHGTTHTNKALWKVIIREICHYKLYPPKRLAWSHFDCSNVMHCRKQNEFSTLQYLGLSSFHAKSSHAVVTPNVDGFEAI